MTYRVSPAAGGGDIFLGEPRRRASSAGSARARQEQSGYAVDAADVDGDGRPEILIGAGFAAHRGRHSGSVYVVARAERGRAAGCAALAGFDPCW